MSESDEEANPADQPTQKSKIGEGKVAEQVDTGTEPEVELGAGKGPAEADTPGVPEVEPGPGGYAGRDPKSEMPRIPTVPETQGDSKEHDGAPPAEGKERQGSE
jgi:hypothetical protein